MITEIESVRCEESASSENDRPVPLTALARATNLSRAAMRFCAATAGSLWDAWNNLPRDQQAPGAMERRSRWFQRTCIRFAGAFDLSVVVSGRAPTRGLLISNHLSYLDIVAIGSVCPTIFVSKSEVGGWPFIGHFARMAGTLFVKRSSKLDVVRLGEEMGARLALGGLVTLFPEGTSSDGSSVLPFRSSLLEPALHHGPVTAAAIRYELDHGTPGTDVCYHGEMTLLPHLLGLMSRGKVRAELNFKRIWQLPSTRKELAVQLQGEVTRLKSDMTVPQRSERAEAGRSLWSRRPLGIPERWTFPVNGSFFPATRQTDSAAGTAEVDRIFGRQTAASEVHDFV